MFFKQFDMLQDISNISFKLSETATSSAYLGNRTYTQSNKAFKIKSNAIVANVWPNSLSTVNRNLIWGSSFYGEELYLAFDSDSTFVFG